MHEQWEENRLYVRGMILAAEIEFEAMKNENYLRQLEGKAPAYGPDMFKELIAVYMLSHNALMTNFKLGM